MKLVNIIVAYCNTINKLNGIGNNNKLPWEPFKNDMRRFKLITTTVNDKAKINAVIMGSSTFDSLSYRPLVNRINIVISRNVMKYYNKVCEHDNLYVFRTFDDAYYFVNNNPIIETIFIIGGEHLYKYILTTKYELIEKIYITEINAIYECDRYFPDFDTSNFAIVNLDIIEENNKKVIYKTLEKNKNINNEHQYLKLIDDIIKNGEKREGRNGTVYSIFGVQHIFDLNEGFPLLTTKKMFFKGIIEELLFFIRGQTNSNILKNKKINIWNGNTSREFLDGRGLYNYKEGDMGPMYGWNWRHYGEKYEGYEKEYKGYDQLCELIKSLSNDPMSRRHLLTTYDPSKVGESVLAPCHGLVIQYNIRDKIYLDCKMYQRSVDVALGYPYNIASYATLTHILCKINGYKPGKLYMTLGDVHIYECHIEGLKEQLKRTPYKFCELKINKNIDKNSSVEDKIKYMELLEYDNFELVNYRCHSVIKMEMVA